jgi:predicted RecA/RadA family phage recombinase
MDGIKTAADNDAVGARRSPLYLIEDTVGAVLEDTDFGEEAVLIYHAEKILVPKELDSLDVFLPGDRVYWDPATRLVTTAIATGGYYWIGIATEPAGAADLRVEIDLCGNKAEIEAAL